MGEAWTKSAQTTTITSPSEYQNINPYTGANMQLLGNEQNFWKQQLAGGNYGMNQFFGPSGYWNQLVGATEAPTADLTRSLEDMYKGILNRQLGEAAGKMTDFNLYSGASEQIMGETASQAAKEIASQSLQGRLGLLQQLGGGALNILGQREQIGGQTYNNLLNLLTQQSELMMTAPEKHYQPEQAGWLQNLVVGGGQAAIGAGLGALTGNPAAAAKALPGEGGGGIPAAQGMYTGSVGPWMIPQQQQYPYMYPGSSQAYGWTPQAPYNPLSNYLNMGGWM